MSKSATVESLPLSKQLACATGQLGWSILVNIVGIVNLVAEKLGKKGLMVAAFAWMAIVFAGVPRLGNLPIDAIAQGYGLVLLLSVPLAVLGVLPNAVLADIADADARRTGQAREGRFFAARTLMQKVGQTAGVVIFAMSTTLGRDVGDDLGIRPSGVIGFALCLVAALVFSRYDEASTIADESMVAT